MRLLVHLHIYYYDQVNYFLEKLANVTGVDWDLFITEAQHNRDIENAFSSLEIIPHYLETGNIGYDIWPFIAVIKSVNTEDYDLVMKLHTKNKRDTEARINGFSLKYHRWRNELVDSLLRSKAHFFKLLNMFKLDNRLGLVCSDWLYVKRSNNRREDLSMLQNEIKRLGFRYTGNYFCAGTMFIARICLFRFLQSDKISSSLFEGEARTGTSGLSSSMAHVYERILSMVPFEYSYTVKTIVTNRFRSACIRFTNFTGPVLRWLFSISCVGEDRVKYLTVLGIRIKIRENQM